ncbi:threonylcarbamoyl-AMP synthase [Patescibacteria group bacterium]|nr:threonylcarbamoyl-AMP synthase [Patescibacteria group bacterium]MBU1029336.1 threonylcarbamoyl-AMP synthase [Patescibacteria group bacterium]MBU1915605.1 threonylcarbamoyl-AMP synthase [Patescibacteria group bacterium]
MKIIKVNKYRVNQKILQQALEVLRTGGVVVHPSESSYGLAVDPRNSSAIKRLFRLKRRSSGKPVLLAAASIDQVEDIVRLSTSLKRLIKQHWPGPLTIVAPAKRRLDLTGTGRPAVQIAIRVPAAAWLRALAKGLGYPVTSTSVNLAGQPPAYSPREIRQIFSEKKLQPDLLLAVGTLPHRSPTTIICQKGQKIKILRPGTIKI